MTERDGHALWHKEIDGDQTVPVGSVSVSAKFDTLDVGPSDHAAASWEADEGDLRTDGDTESSAGAQNEAGAGQQKERARGGHEQHHCRCFHSDRGDQVRCDGGNHCELSEWREGEA